MGTTKLENLLQEIDSLIKTGKLAEGREQFQLLVRGKVPRERVIQVSSMARRLDLPLVSLRLLGPFVRGQRGQKVHTASDEERIEYGAGLLRVGATEEGLELFNQISIPNPLVDLYRGHAHMTLWNYSDAITHLSNYLKAERVDSYQSLITKMNLATCMIEEERFSESKDLLMSILPYFKKEGNSFAEGTVYENLAQIALFERHWMEADRQLNDAETVFTDTDSREFFFVQKWKALKKLFEKPNDDEAFWGVVKIKEEARKRNHWESVRDCDRFMAITRKDFEVFSKVYHGTPFTSFRNKLLKQMGISAPQESFIWYLGKWDKAPLLNVELAKVEGTKLSLPAGELAHRCLIALTLDFYKPIRIPKLFRELFPTEFFNPLSSPNRVHQAVKKLRMWATSNKFPMDVLEISGGYCLMSPSGLQIEVPSSIKAKAVGNEKMETYKAVIESQFGTDVFSARELTSVLKISIRSAYRLIDSAIQQGWLEKRLSGRQMKYVVTSKENSLRKAS